MKIHKRAATALRTFAVACALTAFAGAPAVAEHRQTAGGFTSAATPYHFVFPRDHGIHAGYRTEWWYFTGHLRSTSGRWFGYELTFFRIGLHPGELLPKRGQSRWRTNEIYPAHFALSDISADEFFARERLERGALHLAGAAPNTLDVRCDNWYVRMDRHGDITLFAADSGRRLALRMHSLKPPALHGRNGVSRKGPCPDCASRYYSLSRLVTAGELRTPEGAFRVTGSSWMDHEFASDQLAGGESGWDWFALQLNDGREMMIYRLRRADGTIVPESSASLIERDGRVRTLPRAAVNIQSDTVWRSPHTQALYPSGWHIRCAAAHLDVHVVPAIADQELGGDAGTPAYWEGAATISDARGSAVGRAYVELTGYSAPLKI